MKGGQPTVAYCRHCEEVIRPCQCVAHNLPFWFHWPSKYHRCGPGGTGLTLAEPDGD